jgi:hypothetical protein
MFLDLHHLLPVLGIPHVLDLERKSFSSFFSLLKQSLPLQKQDTDTEFKNLFCIDFL